MIPLNVDNYPTKVNKTATMNNALTTRACSSGKLKETGKTVLTQSTLINDAIKAWNLAPKEVYESLSYNIAKKKTLKCLQKHYQSKIPLIKQLISIVMMLFLDLFFILY